MRAAFFHGAGQPVTIERIDPPQVGPGDVLVEVSRCGICGTDVAMSGDGPVVFPVGRIGHEYAGEIIEVGREVEGLHVGQSVACLPIAPCRSCEACRLGNVIFCTSPVVNADGIGPSGGFAEYTSVPAISARPLPGGLSLPDGALVEPMACGLHAIEAAAIGPGASVLVLGAGSMAMSAVYWTRRLGARSIIVVSRSPHRRDTMLALGADRFHSLAQDDPAELAATLGAGADFVLECVGKPGALESALGYLRPQGTVVSMGVCQHRDHLVPLACASKEARFLFAVGYTIDQFVETARVFDADKVHPEMLVSDTIALEALPAMLDALRAGEPGHTKVLVDPKLEFANGR